MAINPRNPPNVFRVVVTNPATRHSFMSYATLGKFPAVNATKADLLSWLAVSTFSTLGQAHELALKFPRMGDWIAEIDLTALKTRNWACSPPSRAGHIDLYNVAPEDLSQAVVAITPVAR